MVTPVAHRPASRADDPVPGTGVSPLRRRVDSLRDLASTTRPGRLASAGALALVLVLLAGVLGLIAAVRGGGAADDVVTRSGPLTTASQELYRALSDADASAAQAFLAGGGEPADVRLRYQSDITDAGAALAAVTASNGSDGSGSTATADPSAVRIATGLPVYTGLVETARVANRQGLSVGAAYLREASAFLQTSLLPAAQGLYDRQAAARDDEQSTADGSPLALLAALVGIAALVAVVRLHRQVARTTKRRVTPGLVAAGAAVVVGLIWGLLALGGQAVLTASGRSDGTDPTGAVVAARFAALQARTAETLQLVARGAGASYERDYRARTALIRGGTGPLRQALDAADDLDDPALGADLERADAAFLAWDGAHQRLRQSDDGGDYDAAVARALSTAPDGSAKAFGDLESALDRAIDGFAAGARDDAAAADAATTLLGAGIVVLTVLAAAGIVVGLGPRLQEYR